MRKKELERAYFNTLYSVFSADKAYAVKISEPIVKEVTTLLDNTKNHSGVILTAWNPHSNEASRNENNRQNYALSQDLIRNNFIYYDALGEGQDTSWEAEESFFIIDISKEQAEHLAVKYKQNAYVWLQKNKPVELIFSAVWND